MLGRSPRGVHPQLRSLEVFQDEAPRLLHEAKKSMSHFDNISVRWTTQLPQNLTWNLKITHQKRKRSQSVFLGFHVSFRGGGVHYLGKVKLPLKNPRETPAVQVTLKLLQNLQCCILLRVHLIGWWVTWKANSHDTYVWSISQKHRKYYYSCFTGDKWDNGIIIPPGK